MYPDSTFIIENTAVFKRNLDVFVVVSEQRMIGNYVNVVILNGNLSFSSNNPSDLAFIPLSYGGEVYAENVKISFSSAYPDYWRKVGAEVDGNVVTEA